MKGEGKKGKIMDLDLKYHTPNKNHR
jgi:hypothetical protein